MLPTDLPLQIGDRLRVVCPELPVICVERAVGPDGSLDLPLVGAVPAASRTVDRLSETISRRLPLQSDPVLLRIDRLGAASGEVEVAGAVEHPMRLFAPRGIAQERLLRAAVASPAADLALLGRDRRLKAGESLYVSTIRLDRKISVLGGVASPKMLPPTNGLLLAEALEAAGGLSAHADLTSVLVERNGEDIPLAMPANAAFAILPGDTIRVGLVEDRRFVLVRRGSERPQTVAFASGMTALQAVKAAGGILEKAKGGTLIWQSGAKTTRLSIDFLLDRRIPDPLISAGDTLRIEAGV